MKSESTYHALLARGIDSATANHLIDSKISLNKLKTLSLDKLLRCGLNENQANLILKEERPPIPIETVKKLIFESRSICCICRDRNKPFIIHHIIDWEKSRDNSEKNLVVLCLNDHGETHSKHSLSQNLTPQLIKDSKTKWIKRVGELDSEAVSNLLVEGSRWDYINHARLIELANNLQIQLNKTKLFETLFSHKVLDHRGYLTQDFISKAKRKPYMYDFGFGLQLYEHHKELLESIIKRLQIVDLKSTWSKTQFTTWLKPGMFFAFQGASYFKKGKKLIGKEIRECYRQAKKIKLSFTINAWEATSCSAWVDSMSGHKSITAICFLRGLSKRNGILQVNTSCLCIGSYFKSFPSSRDQLNAIFSYPEEFGNDGMIDNN